MWPKAPRIKTPILTLEQMESMELMEELLIALGRATLLLGC